MKRVVTTFALFVALFVFVGAPVVQAQELIFVDDDASGADDGSSWSDAHPNLQDALSAATDDDVIAVAAGIYYPDIGEGIPVDDRETSFTITGAKDGLKIYGGYAGDENISLGNLMLNARDFEVNETTLSGDVDGTPNDMSRNSYHLLYLDGRTAANITSDTRIDGFVVTLGNASGSASENNDSGGGLFCDGGDEGNECSPTLVNIVFTENRAEVGGAVYNYGSGGASNPTIVNSTFMSNTTEGGFPGNGGAIFNDGSGGGNSSPVIKNTSFKANSATEDGGAIYNDAFNGISSPEIFNSSFEGNTADPEGVNGDGGVICSDSGNGMLTSPVIARSIFTDNTASRNGGTIFVDGESKITNSTFVGNTADSDGGAVYSSTRSENLEIVNAVFAGNTADIDGNEGTGGAIFINENDDASKIVNTVFSGNTASLSGGAIYIEETSPTIVNASFSENEAFESGGAIYNGEDFEGGSSPTVANSIFFDNSGAGNGDQIFNEGENSEPTVRYSLVEGGCTSIPGAICGDGNLTGDPQFADADGPDDTPGTENDDLRLQGPGSENGPSSAIDAGENTAVPDTLSKDVTGEMSRFYNVEEIGDTGNGTAPIVDMGAYESDGSRLPVELATFTAHTDGRAAVLEWQTASETNNAGFRVERRPESADNWTRVTFIESKTGGNSQTPTTYQFHTPKFDYGQHTFRLVQRDLDGSETPVGTQQRVQIELSKAYDLSAPRPNPFSERATVDLAVREKQDVTVAVYDMLGRRVQVLHEGPMSAQQTKHFTVRAQGLSSGTYFVRVVGKAFTETRRLVLTR